jgi:hypothetical protein
MNGDYLWRVNDHARTHREIARHPSSTPRPTTKWQGDGRDGALRQADPQRDAAGSCRSIRAARKLLFLATGSARCPTATATTRSS